ncbi:MULTISPECIES: hypothetical protein [unclassified Chryseobacterium]|uniref:hypothetical protein n=1 Tax=unclassified Chryseobacterium TaxID=2593645 RepID=UPI000954B49B|nr:MULTISPECIES: hypothetical protein [unclassified Chryseobacterium]SIR55762.1 hypothetical protein SAMN05880573_1279 [Chryseobacterium sp. RU33C]
MEISFFKNELIILDESYIQDFFLGKTKEELLNLLGQPNEDNGNEWLYLSKHYFIRFYQKRLFIFFSQGNVNNYCMYHILKLSVIAKFY